MFWDTSNWEPLCAILAARIAAEGFSADPIIPVRGDVSTIGHGATRYDDGTRMTMADPPITRERARDLAMNLLEQQYGACVRDSLGDTQVHVAEFAQAVDFAGQYDCGAWRRSLMLAHTRAGDYAGACNAYLAYRFMTRAQPLQGYSAFQWDEAGHPKRWRFDCSTPGNRICRGVWIRQQARHAACMEANEITSDRNRCGPGRLHRGPCGLRASGLPCDRNRGSRGRDGALLVRACRRGAGAMWYASGP